MTSVNSVAGVIDSTDLGITLVHEHLRTRREDVPVQFPHLYDDTSGVAAVIEQVRAAQARGLRTICDPTVLGLGRDVRFMSAVAHATGLQVIAATGIYTFDKLPGYFATRGIDALADAFVHDLEVGIQGTDSRAGFIKCTTDAPGITTDVEKLLRAAARAHRRTGRPIMTHSHPATGTGLAQQEIFLSEGVDLRRVLIGHCGDTADLGYLERTAQRGSYLGMDRYAWPFFMAAAERNRTVAAMVERGYGGQMMLSHDCVCDVDVEWFGVPQERRPLAGLTRVFDETVPALVAAGVSDETVAAMLGRNVSDWFARSDPY